MAALDFKVSYTVNGVTNSSQFTTTPQNDYARTLGDLLQFTRTSLITIASDALREEQGKGFDKKPTVIVDGKFGGKIEQVSPLGKIQYVARQEIRDLVLFSYDAILFRSKVVTGTYSKSNWVYYNNTKVAWDLASLNAWLNSNPGFKDTDKIRFVNTQPYARKLERYGVTAQRSQRKDRKPKKGERKKGHEPGPKGGVLVPNGTYVLASRAISNKYKNNSFIKYELMLGTSFGLTGKEHTYQTGLTPGRPYLYPTILIYVKEAGVVV